MTMKTSRFSTYYMDDYCGDSIDPKEHQSDSRAKSILTSIPAKMDFVLFRNRTADLMTKICVYAGVFVGSVWVTHALVQSSTNDAPDFKMNAAEMEVATSTNGHETPCIVLQDRFNQPKIYCGPTPPKPITYPLTMYARQAVDRAIESAVQIPRLTKTEASYLFPEQKFLGVEEGDIVQPVIVKTVRIFANPIQTDSRGRKILLSHAMPVRNPERIAD